MLTQFSRSNRSNCSFTLSHPQKLAAMSDAFEFDAFCDAGGSDAASAICALKTVSVALG